jgi:hypothetical protein
MERVTITSRHEPPAHLVFLLLRCCADMATSSRSSTCICDRESRSPEPSSSAILHQEMVNKVFGKRSSRLLACSFKFFTTARLPLRRTRAEGHRLQCNLRQADRHLHPIIIVKEAQVTYGFSSQIIFYLLHILICVGIILLDNLLQCDSTATLICNALVMSMIYP